MSKIAVGTQVFKRTKRLESLLNSIPPCISRVYVAENGNIDERKHLYSRTYNFDLVVLDLQYDAGLGKSRKIIVEKSSEPFMVFVDSDHTIPHNITILRDILEGSKRLGGVSGSMIEFMDGIQYSITGQFIQIDDSITRNAFLKKPKLQYIWNYPVFYFDFIANAAMFKRECLESYVWDSEYTIGFEHIDFYLGHKLQTDWEFGICPTVQFEHYPGGSKDYDNERHNTDKLEYSKRYFLDKWGLESDECGCFKWVNSPPGKMWIEYSQKPLWKKAILMLIGKGWPVFWKSLKERYQ